MDAFVDCCTYPLARGSECFPYCWSTVTLCHQSACLPSLGESFLYCCSRFRAFIPLRHTWYPSLCREYCLRCFGASFGKLPRGLRCGVFDWPVCSPRLCRNLSTTCHRDISTCNSCRLNCRSFGLVRMARLWVIRPPRSTVAITMLWSESALAGVRVGGEQPRCVLYLDVPDA